jgi:hypothetical protein
MDLQASTTKSERLTVLLSVEDKRSIEQRAREAKMSVGEFVRRASQSYSPESEIDRETLEALVKVWHENVTHMRDRIRQTLKVIDDNNAEIRALREARHGAR